MASYEKRTWWSRHQLTERLADDAFLEAAVTSAFLVAAADGSQSDTEYDALPLDAEQEQLVGLGALRSLQLVAEAYLDAVAGPAAVPA